MKEEQGRRLRIGSRGWGHVFDNDGDARFEKQTKGGSERGFVDGVYILYVSVCVRPRRTRRLLCCSYCCFWWWWWR
jgi:hypothetical protein